MVYRNSFFFHPPSLISMKVKTKRENQRKRHHETLWKPHRKKTDLAQTIRGPSYGVGVCRHYAELLHPPQKQRATVIAGAAKPLRGLCSSIAAG